MRILDDVTDAIGATPLIRLRRLAAGLPGDVVVKQEGLNPGGSLKNRIALHMIDDALSRGVLRPGMVVVEPTSGNTGIGLAQVAAVQPASSPLLTGGAPGPHLQTGLSGGFLAPVLDTTVFDEVFDVPDDLAYAVARDLARQEALLVGASSGGVVGAAFRVAAREESAGKLVVAVLFDSGERYLSTPLFTGTPAPSLEDLAALFG